MPQVVRLVCVAVLWAALSIRAGEPAPVQQGGATMSPEMRAVLKAALPLQGAFVPAPPKSATDPVSPHPEGDASVIRMPKYIVNDVRTPTAKEAMSPKALAEVAMNQYLGSKDGLDRGFLYEDERLRRMNDLLDLSTVTARTGDPGLGEKIPRETEKTFIRK